MRKLAEFLKFCWIGVHGGMIAEILMARKKPLTQQRLSGKCS
jgi:hypothetical protein